MINKRRFLADRMRGLGLLSAVERLSRRPGLLVLVYHRIGDPAETDDYGPVFSATPEGFRDQVRAVSRSFRLLGPDELIEAASGERPPTEPCAAVTFDDGYVDQFERALPILRDLGASATYFLPPALIDRPRPFWWDLVSRAVRRSTRDRLEVEYPARLTVDLARSSREEGISRIVGACLAERRLDADRLAEHLLDRAGLDLDLDALGRSAMMTWEQARELADSGMGIGSHGRTHRRLADLDEQEQREELSRSRRELEERIGRPVRSISYPYGSADDYDDRTIRLARESGYRAGFTFGGPATSGDPFRVSRINVGSADTPTMVRARLALGHAFGRSII